MVTYALPYYVLGRPDLLNVVYSYLALWTPVVLYRPWTLVTYMFLHGSFMHLLFNMIGLFFFGPRLEERLGGKDFLKLYFGSGIGAALFTLAAGSVGMTLGIPVLAAVFGAPVVGASGAVFGILVGYALYWPRHEIWIWGVLPVQARWLVIFLLVTTLWSGITGSRSGTAHFAHLGGLVVGYAYLKWRDWRRGAAGREFRKRAEAIPSEGIPEMAARRRWESIRVEELHELNRGEVQALLARIDESGVKSLSREERAFLDRMAAS